MDKAPSAPRSFEIAIGLIMGTIGVGLLSLVAMLLYKLVEQRNLPGTTFLLISSSLAIVGAFCSLVSYRLVTNRGVRGGGGLLSPVGWRVLGWMFMALAATMAGAVIWQQQWTYLLAPIFAVGFGQMCFSAAANLSKQVEGGLQGKPFKS